MKLGVGQVLLPQGCPLRGSPLQIIRKVFNMEYTIMQRFNSQTCFPAFVADQSEYWACSLY